MTSLSFKLLKLQILFLLSLSSILNANAKPSIGYGYEPKYPPNFKSFEYANENAPKGGVLNLTSLGTSFDSLNPFLLKGNSVSGIENLIFETLMESSADEPYSLYGLLADDINVSQDGMSVTFHINAKARFSNNTAVTADDVRFSFDTLMSKKAHPGYRIFWADIESAEVLADNHIRFHFKKKNPELHMIISGLPVFPKSWVGEDDFDKISLNTPIGSGPYLLDSYQLGKQASYKINPDYWAKDLNVRKGQFNFKEINYRYYKDRTVALEAFKAGEFDYMSVYSSKSWAKDYSGKQFDSGNIIKKNFNHQNNEAIQGFVMNTRRELFADKRVREALGLAFDFEWANRMLFYGQYTRCYSYFSNSDLAATGKPSDAELKILEPYRAQLNGKVYESVWQPPKTSEPDSLRKNLRKAISLLKEAGWQYKDGALRNSKGEAFTFHLMLSSKAFERIAAVFARNLDIIGIKMDYRIIDQALYLRKLQTFDFDMTTMRYGQKQSPGNELMNRWHSSSADIEGSSNHAGIKNPVIDALLGKLVQTKDRETLINYAKILDRILLSEHYIIPQWFIAYHRVAFWDKFEWPKTLPKYYNDKDWMIQYWWEKKVDSNQ
ncbi:MAG: ABC transporter substrate-binding protein [Gammaproteobacteria bacterium]|nr:ABC transporter substrate-binding protein [Gammaproteobacteria bacterium]